jgi:hypothetical protein
MPIINQVPNQGHPLFVSCAWVLQQAYREWQRNTSVDALFIINNDVLVPDGVIDAMASALTPEGRCLRTLM